MCIGSLYALLNVNKCLKLLTKVVLIPIVRNYALVAQLDRVLGYEPSGRRFESFRARHIEWAFQSNLRGLFYAWVTKAGY
jgi:2-keto-3-deoxy-L-rhamnonate aldolase RhmA